jgi:hypothetical protein
MEYTTFTSPDFDDRTVVCSVKGCPNKIRQWLSRWGWLGRCHECAAKEWRWIQQCRR